MTDTPQVPTPPEPGWEATLVRSPDPEVALLYVWVAGEDHVRQLNRLDPVDHLAHGREPSHDLDTARVDHLADVRPIALPSDLVFALSMAFGAYYADPEQDDRDLALAEALDEAVSLRQEIDGMRLAHADRLRALAAVEAQRDRLEESQALVWGLLRDVLRVPWPDEPTPEPVNQQSQGSIPPDVERSWDQMNRRAGWVR